MRRQNVTNLFANSNRGVQRQRGLLKNQRNTRTANTLECPKFYLKKVLPFEQNRTPLNFSVSWKESQQSQRECAFARPGLA
jgi:hypothetical protein